MGWGVSREAKHVAGLDVVQHAIERSGLLPAGSRLFSDWINLGQAGVLAFFLVSGFVIPLSLERRKSLLGFAISRVFRIYPLYLCVFALACLLLYGAPSPKAVIAQLSFTSDYIHAKNYVPPSWTLSIESVWYVAFAFLFTIGLARASWLIAIGLGCVIVAGGLAALHGLPIPMGRLGMLATCVVGLFAYRYFVEGRDRKNLYAAAILVAGIVFGLVAGFGLAPNRANAEFGLTCVLISWSLGYAIFATSFFLKPRGRVETVMRYLGEISYSIYLVHMFSLAAFERLGVSGWAYVLLVLLSAIAISAVTFAWIEKPCNRLGTRLSKRVRDKAARA